MFFLPVPLTVQSIHPCTHQQHRQRQNQAAVHGDPLPWVGNVPQALDGHDPIVRHYRWTQAQPRAATCSNLRPVYSRRRLFLTCQSSNLLSKGQNLQSGALKQRQRKGHRALRASGSTVSARDLPEEWVFVWTVASALPQAGLCSVLCCS